VDTIANSHRSSAPSSGASKNFHASTRRRFRSRAFIGLALVALIGVVAGESSAATLDMGDSRACAVKDGQVYCWGKLPFATPEGAFTTSNIAIAIEGATGVSDISVGTAHTCAIADTGPLCWGDWTLGHSVSPVSVSGLQAGAVTSIAAGFNHTCAVVSGGVKCWGIGSKGQLGTGFVDASSIPKGVVELGANSGATKVAAGVEFSCAIVGGGVKCWGAGTFGKLGNGSSADTNTPVDVSGLAAGSSLVTDLALGNHFACALLNDGEVRCWGAGGAGSLGNGGAASSAVPVAVIDQNNQPIAGAARLAAGAFHACADGGAGTQLHCWGRGIFGQLGSENELAWKAVPVTDWSGTVEAVAAGAESTCVRNPEGDIHCFGLNLWGELGIGDDASAEIPEEVAGLSAIQLIATGGYHTCAANAAEVFCWGTAGAQLGLGLLPAEDQKTPALVAAHPAGDVTHLAVGTAHSCSRNALGEIHCWGHNYAGQLGTDSFSVHYTPAKVAGAFLSVASLSDHTCAVTEQNQAQCWGEGSRGQLGGNSQQASPSPQTVVDELGVPLANVVQAAAGAMHSCALAAGQVWCWGGNDSGQTGSAGGDSAFAQPVALPADASAISVGGAHSCAILVDNSTWCWGSDLSSGITESGPTPRLHPLPNIVAMSAATTTNTCATTADNLVRCWGENDYGQLGAGNFADTLAADAAAVSFESAAIPVAIATAPEYSCAVLDDGSVHCWGNGLFGRRGDGDIGYTTAPLGAVIFPVEIFADGFEDAP
jgi:alpha-tubulin suppressor-like RCC1 family protein